MKHRGSKLKIPKTIGRSSIGGGLRGASPVVGRRRAPRGFQLGARIYMVTWVLFGFDATGFSPVDAFFLWFRCLVRMVHVVFHRFLLT
jgi:hypothetical protein